MSKIGHAALTALVLGGCAAGAPTGFSAGDHWTAPLVGPLENGLLLVPVYVGTAGPYVFALDPDANVSIVDDKIVKEAGLRSGQGPRLDDELDHQNEHFYAEILELRVGTLYVQNKSALIVKTGTYNTNGREVDGVLGRDIIADSLVFGFDRDAGLMTLLTQEAWKKQQVEGTAVHYELLSDRNRTEMPAGRRANGMNSGGGLDLDVVPVSRRITDAMIDGTKFTVHLDFGGLASQLRVRSWEAAKLEAHPMQGMLIDETGTGRPIDKLGTAAQVALGPLTTSNVEFVPYAEQRWREQDLEGALGLDFFMPYTVWANWDSKTIQLVPRHDAALTARIGRWQMRELSACTTPGCVSTTIIDPLAKLPPDAPRPAQNPGVVVSFARDPATAHKPLEALVSVKTADGAKHETLVVSLPADADRAMTHLSGEYAGATLTVLDADPFPRTCPQQGGCVDVLASVP
jgi:hypothetical protein